MLTRQWLQNAYPLRTTCCKESGKVINEWFDCGARVDPAIGVTRCRVLEVDTDAFVLEIGQSVADEPNWEAGVCIPLSSPAELITIVDALLCKNRV